MGPLRRIALLALLALPPATAHAYPAPNDPFLPAPSVLVSIEVTGGLGGVDDYMAIGSNGAARLDTRSETRQFRASRREMKRLRAALAAARWTRLHSDYPARGDVVDGFAYSIIYRGHGVRTEDGARRPARLQRVLTALLRIRSRHG